MKNKAITGKPRIKKPSPKKETIKNLVPPTASGDAVKGGAIGRIEPRFPK